MADKDKLPGHKWDSWEVVQVNGTNRFKYKCSRCQARVLDGERFVPELLWKCGK
jgi:hypothetical protein